jgi:clan AA aspartic protease (TIGR02281 family)
MANSFAAVLFGCRATRREGALSARFGRPRMMPVFPARGGSREMLRMEDAVRHGWKLAGVALALWLGIGEGRAQTDALEQYRRGATQGDSSALNGLGGLYETGSGVPLDYAKAYALFGLAASMPNVDAAQATKAKQSRDALALKMSSIQLTRAQQLLTLCYGGDINLCGQRIIGDGQPNALPAGKTIVPLENANGLYVVPVLVNGTTSLKFAIDTGATDVAIPADIVANLMKDGLVAKADFLGERTYVLADGSRMPSQIFQIHSLKIGDVVVTNVRASITPEKRGALLLGQSFFGRLKSWSLDNSRHTLIIE